MKKIISILFLLTGFYFLQGCGTIMQNVTQSAINSKSPVNVSDTAVRSQPEHIIPVFPSGEKETEPGSVAPFTDVETFELSNISLLMCMVIFKKVCDPLIAISPYPTGNVPVSGSNQ